MVGTYSRSEMRSTTTGDDRPKKSRISPTVSKKRLNSASGPLAKRLRSCTDAPPPSDETGSPSSSESLERAEDEHAAAVLLQRWFRGIFSTFSRCASRICIESNSVHVRRSACVLLVEPGGVSHAICAKSLVEHFVVSADFSHPTTKRELTIMEVNRALRRMRASPGLTRVIRATHLFSDRIRDSQRSSASLIALLEEDCGKPIDAAMEAAEATCLVGHLSDEASEGAGEQLEATTSSTAETPAWLRSAVRRMTRKVEDELDKYEAAFDTLLLRSPYAARVARHHLEMFGKRRRLLVDGPAELIDDMIRDSVERAERRSTRQRKPVCKTLSKAPALWEWFSSVSAREG